VSNIKGEQPLPLDMPEQPAERFTVRPIPGLALWSVWDARTDSAVSFPAFPSGVFWVRDRAQGYADNLNGTESRTASIYRLSLVTMLHILDN
jgi:hypothetical protein